MQFSDQGMKTMLEETDSIFDKNVVIQDEGNYRKMMMMG